MTVLESCHAQEIIFMGTNNPSAITSRISHATLLGEGEAVFYSRRVIYWRPIDIPLQDVLFNHHKQERITLFSLVT